MKDLRRELHGEDLESLKLVEEEFLRLSKLDSSIIVDYRGFNSETGCIYFVLDNGIQITSKHGQDVKFLVEDSNTGEKTFFSELPCTKVQGFLLHR